MNTFVIVHATRAPGVDADAVVSYRDYQTVAIVEADDLGGAFTVSNTIDRPWIENDGVVHHFAEEMPYGCRRRSTSVGDIIVFLARDGGSPSVHKVAPHGFEDISGSFTGRVWAMRGRGANNLYGHEAEARRRAFLGLPEPAPRRKRSWDINGIVYEDDFAG